MFQAYQIRIRNWDDCSFHTFSHSHCPFAFFVDNFHMIVHFSHNFLSVFIVDWFPETRKYTRMEMKRSWHWIIRKQKMFRSWNQLVGTPPLPTAGQELFFFVVREGGVPWVKNFRRIFIQPPTIAATWNTAKTTDRPSISVSQTSVSDCVKQPTSECTGGGGE